MPADYKHTDDDDLLIENGDFAVGESTVQHQGLLIRLKKGELRQFGKTGVDLDSFLLDDNAGAAYREIQKQFEADGLRVLKVQIYQTGEIKTDAFYP